MLDFMYRLMLIFMMLAGSQLNAAEIYMTVDENGNRTFTDQPSDDAEKIEVKDITTIPALRNTSPPDRKPEPGEIYSKLLIVSPKSDETYFRSEGDLIIAVQVSPRLRSGDQFVYVLDGQRVHSSASGTYVIAEMDRGTHNVSVSIINSVGDVIKTSDPVTFHMRQASVLGR